MNGRCVESVFVVPLGKYRENSFPRPWIWLCAKGLSCNRSLVEPQPQAFKCGPNLVWPLEMSSSVCNPLFCNKYTRWFSSREFSVGEGEGFAKGNEGSLKVGVATRVGGRGPCLTLPKLV